MDKFLSSRCHVNKNKVKKSIFFYFVLIMSLPACMFLVSKVDPLIANSLKQKSLC